MSRQHPPAPPDSAERVERTGRWRGPVAVARGRGLGILGYNARLLILAVAGGASGILVALGDALVLQVVRGEFVGETPWGGYTDSTWAFVGKPASVLWLATTAGSVSLWMILLVPVRVALNHLPRQERKAPVFLVGVIVACLIAGVTAWAALEAYPALPGVGLKFVLLSALAVNVGLRAYTGIWRVDTAVGALVDKDRLDPADLQRYLHLRDVLQRLLSIHAAILASAIVAATAWRGAVLAWNPAEAVPIEYILVYGGYLSGLLALIVAPAYTRLRALASKIVDQFGGLPRPTETGWSTAYERRRQLEEFLDPRTIARAAGVVAVPLMTSVVGALIDAL